MGKREDLYMGLQTIISFMYERDVLKKGGSKYKKGGSDQSGCFHRFVDDGLAEIFSERVRPLRTNKIREIAKDQEQLIRLYKKIMIIYGERKKRERKN